MEQLFPPFAMSAFLTGLGWSALGLIMLLGVTFTIGVVQRRHAVIDVAWGLGFVVIAAISFVTSAGHGDDLRRITLLVVTSIWGLRLAGFLALRLRGKGEDPRYVTILDEAPGNRNLNAVRKAYLPQAIVLFFVSLVQQIGMAAGEGVRAVLILGIAVWLLGFVFEAVGDWQLERFRNDPSKHGTILDTGLWSVTRHPNYFGDVAVWWGMFLITASAWPGVLTVLSPILMTLAIVHRTGMKLTERRMLGRPGFAEYVAKTPGFIPWIGKKG